MSTETDTRLKWVDEANLTALITHVRCMNCLTTNEFHRTPPKTVEAAQDMDPGCGCDDPIAEPIIVSDKPLIGTDADDDFLIKARSFRGADVWEYDVSEDTHGVFISGSVQ